MRRLAGWVLAVVAGLVALPLHAHIGSPAVVFDGTAGPYPVRVIVLPPPVVPGRAEINVRLLQEESGPVTVTVLPVNWNAGLKGAPAPDEARPVRDDPSLRHAELWLMTSGAYSVHVAVEGPRGAGTVIVPVDSIATRRLPMAPALGVLLAFLGVTLFAGAVTLIGLGASDAITENDAAKTAAHRRRRWIFSGLALGLGATLLYGGKRWWDEEDRNYRANQIYRPLPLTATYQAAGKTILLEVPRESDQPARLHLIPDHGKLMHLFMLREPQLDALAHLHPVRAGPRSFQVAAPPLPAGTYRLYADITNETGFAATLTTTVELPATATETASSASRDPDDSWFIGTPASAANESTTLVRTGPATLRAGEDVTLSFAANDRAGHPVELEPYMGMLGHAAVRRADGSVFAHIHPVGTISMAAQMYFQRTAAEQTGQPPPMDHSQHAMPTNGASTLAFPYLFPQPGDYRIWVQAKIHGQVITRAFDLTVESAK